MSLFDLGSLTPEQRHTVIASFLGWMQDAFDFFILIFVVALLAGFGAEAKGIAFGRQREGSRSSSRRSPTPPDAVPWKPQRPAAERWPISCKHRLASMARPNWLRSVPLPRNRTIFIGRTIVLQGAT
jgi:hypothetical protein